MRVAIPCEAPGGMDAAVSPHFGHAAAFTLVDVVGGEPTCVGVVPNDGHERGGCMALVSTLKQAGVQIMAAGGMGRRPLLGFQQMGIDVCFSAGASSVQDAVLLVASGRANRFGTEHVCRDHGSGGCGSGG